MEKKLETTKGFKVSISFPLNMAMRDVAAVALSSFALALSPAGKP